MASQWGYDRLWMFHALAENSAHIHFHSSAELFFLRDLRVLRVSFLLLVFV
jgi:hypothetical protein